MAKSGDFMFSGEYNCKIDSKGRITLPSKLRDQLEGTTFFITRGLERCIDLFTEEVWNEKIKKLSKLSMTNPKQRAYLRIFLSAATELTFDSQGRISIPKALKEYANMKKEITVTGINDRIEIWDTETWGVYLGESVLNYVEIAASLED